MKNEKHFLHDKLANDGGVPVRQTPFPPWPYFSDQEIDIVGAVLRSGKVNYWTGEEGRSFEREFAEHCMVSHAVAVANGTVALELALIALGIGPGDEVIVTPRSFIASASCVALVGARAVFADVDPLSQNITAQTIEPHITRRTKAVIAVHLAGLPCEMDAIRELAEKHNLFVIEDCAQAHGASYHGKPVGSMGHVSAFSFCQDKIISTGGEGGMLVTNDEAVWRRAWEYKDHGKSFRAVYQVEHEAGFRWLHESFGTNWRMTEMQAAIGRLQLRKLPEWHRLRGRNAALLREGLQGIPGLRLLAMPERVEHGWYKFYAFVKPEALKSGWSRDRIMNTVVAEGVPCFSGSCSEIYLEKAFANKEGMSIPRPLPVARELGETSLMFPVHPTMQLSDMADVMKAVLKVFQAAVV